MGGKGHIQGPSAVRAFASLLSCATVPLGEDGCDCPAIDLLPTLKGLNSLLFEGAAITGFVESMRAESRQDPSERLLSRAVHEGHCFIPTLLAPEASDDRRDKPASSSQKAGSCGSLSSKRVNSFPSLPEAFLSDDRFAAMGVDV